MKGGGREWVLLKNLPPYKGHPNRRRRMVFNIGPTFTCMAQNRDNTHQSYEIHI